MKWSFMINQLSVNISGGINSSNENIRLKLGEEFLLNEEDKFLIIKNIISTLTSAAIDIQIKADCLNRREVDLVQLTERINHINSKLKINKSYSLLTRREKQILSLVLNGLTNKEISAELFICLDTVKSHRKNILYKTGSRNTASLVKSIPASAFIAI